MKKINKNTDLTTIIFRKVTEFIRANSLEKPIFIIGLSGGPDSVCLAHILNKISKELNFKLIAGHFDHQWRVDSYKDREFCELFCKEEEIELITGLAKDFLPHVKKSRSKEEFGRLLRIAFFKSVIEKTNANAVILAHHAKDQIETFFIRLIRGASLAGLSGMREWNPPIFRPMLECQKELIDQFLASKNLNFVIDPTNSSHDFLRNRIRLSVIPALESIDPRFCKKAGQSINNLSDENQILENILKINILKNDSGQNTVDLEKFLALEKPLQFRLLIQLFVLSQATFKPSHGLLNEAIKFLKTNSENSSLKHTLGEGLSIYKKKSFFYVKS